MDASFAVTRKLVKKERRLQLEWTSLFPQGWDPPTPTHPPVNWELHQDWTDREVASAEPRR